MKHRLIYIGSLLIAFAILSIPKNVTEYAQADRLPQSDTFGNISVGDAPQSEKDVLLADPAMKFSWGMNGTSKADVSASKAWTISRGNRDIIVAVIDTGVDINHPDLKNNLWVNKGESGLDANGKDKAINGIDDDNNGFIDDVHGWNFVENNNSLVDNHGHGTHVSGIIGAEGDNGIGISGIAPKVSVMVLKYYDPKAKSNDNLGNTIKAIQYATKMNAKIINYSGGGLEFSREEFNAIRQARQSGILFVAAAGNERSNSDIHRYYPADYNLDNIISVTALNPNGEVLSSSNFGTESVHIAAPGENIFSTLPGSKYGHMTGTSQATPFVAGVAALIYANNSEFNYQQVRKQILNTTDEIPGLKQKTKTSGKLNSYAALAIQDSIPANGAFAKDQLSFNNDSALPENNNLGIRGLSSLAAAINSSIESENKN